MGQGLETGVPASSLQVCKSGIWDRPEIRTYSDYQVRHGKITEKTGHLLPVAINRFYTSFWRVYSWEFLYVNK